MGVGCRVFGLELLVLGLGFWGLLGLIAPMGFRGSGFSAFWGLGFIIGLGFTVF